MKEKEELKEKNSRQINDLEEELKEAKSKYE